MVSKQTSSASKVISAIRDAIKSFPKQEERVEEVLRVTREVIAIIRERKKGFDKEISQIERDCCIFASRIIKIEDKLFAIERRATKSKKSPTKMKECVKSFMDWFWMNRDFVTSFKEVELAWVVTENSIFISIEDNNETI